MDKKSKPDQERHAGGAPKKIKTPELLEAYFLEYAKEVKANPRLKEMGSPMGVIEVKMECPLTFAGFNVYLYKKVKLVKLESYRANLDGRYDEFTEVCTWIEQCVASDQITGGMIGQYNASITQRLNNLAENIKTTADETFNPLNIDPIGDAIKKNSNE